MNAAKVLKMDDGQQRRTSTSKQLKLFHLECCLGLRFGKEFFRALPRAPGVYFFYANDDRLLYIGQSADLRARIGSYRHVAPSRHPRRTIRLVAKVARVEWRVCSSASDAIEQERVLLLTHRPPFNRAGVWQGTGWWLKAEAMGSDLCLQLTRDAEGVGPFPASFRYVYGSLIRSLYRSAYPQKRLHEYPHGLSRGAVPLHFTVPLPCSQTAVAQLMAFLRGESNLTASGTVSSCPSNEETLWADDAERLSKFFIKAEKGLAFMSAEASSHFVASVPRLSPQVLL